MSTRTLFLQPRVDARSNVRRLMAPIFRKLSSCLSLDCGVGQLKQFLHQCRHQDDAQGVVQGLPVLSFLLKLPAKVRKVGAKLGGTTLAKVSKKLCPRRKLFRFRDSRTSCRQLELPEARRT